jgi:flagellar biosynthesis regulator FlaF
MGRPGEYRWFAARCLEIARATADTQTKAAMLQMAQVWSRLAEETQGSEQDRPEELSARGIDLNPR